MSKKRSHISVETVLLFYILSNKDNKTKRKRISSISVAIIFHFYLFGYKENKISEKISVISFETLSLYLECE